MNGADDKPTGPHPTEDSFESLAAALEQSFEKKFAELPEADQKHIARVMGLSIPAALSPEEVQKRIERALKHEIPVAELPEYIQERNALAWALSTAAVLWNVRSPRGRRGAAQEWDIQNHPSLAQERNALWKKTEEVDDCERTGSNIPIENWTPTDVELQGTKLRRLCTEKAAIEAVMRHKAKGLGLPWPVDDRASIPENAWIPENVSEESFRVVKNEPGGGGRAQRGHRRRRVIDEMVRQVKKLEITLDEFTNLSQPDLAERFFGVSRSTSEPARKEVLARLRAEWLALKHKKTDPGRRKTDCDD